MTAMNLPLSGPGAVGMYALVDEADIEAVSGYRWYPLRNAHTTYVRTRVAGNRSIYLHRFLFGLERHDARIVDHINHDGLDNRRENLRVLDQSTNMANRSGPARNGRSGVLGVCFDNTRQMYLTSLHHQGRRLVSRRFHSAAEAAKFRNDFITANGLPHSLSDIAAAAALDAAGVAA